MNFWPDDLILQKALLSGNRSRWNQAARMGLVDIIIKSSRRQDKK
jgi:hypothetical protein